MEEPLQGPPERPHPPLPLLGLAACFYAVLLGAAVLWAWLEGRSLFYANPQASLRGVRPLLDVSAGLLAAALAVWVSQVLTRRTPWGERLGRALGSLLGRRSWPECAALAALSGIAEEAFFRGALQPQVGLVAASVLFGLAHFAPRRELLPWTAFSLAAGFLLGGLFAATGNLLAPVIAHAGINAVNLHWLGERWADAERG